MMRRCPPTALARRRASDLSGTEEASLTSQYDVLKKAADAVSTRLGRAPVGVVLGSGLGECLDHIEHPQFMDYAEIPGMPTTATAGHRGSLLYGRIDDVAVLALCGRVHIYEDRPLTDVAAPVRLLSLLGVHTLVVTSSVASTDKELRPGHVMLVEDHINLSGVNVLAGEDDERFGPIFVDLNRAYDAEVLSTLETVAAQAQVPCSRGVIVHTHGPSYETPAEVRLAIRLGARAVSLSMVPDVLVALQRGMRVGGLACVTGMAAGIEDGPLRREDHLRSSAANLSTLQGFLSGALPRLATYSSDSADK